MLPDYLNLNTARFIFSQAEMLTTEANFDGVAEGGDFLNHQFGPLDQAHFLESAGEVGTSFNAENSGANALFQFTEGDAIAILAQRFLLFHTHRLPRFSTTRDSQFIKKFAIIGLLA
jgi:hypothetical protein